MSSNPSDDLPQWLDEQNPYDEEASQTQIHSLLEILQQMAGARAQPLRIVELGCGTGRILLPLAAAGHDLTGIDHNSDALAQCRSLLDEQGHTAVLLEQDFIHQPWPAQRYDAVLCLGNTLMTIADLHEALSLIHRVAGSLADRGVFILDDLPGEFWPELTEGNWQSGISEDGSAQLIWDERDSVFALRCGDEVDVNVWTFKPQDRRLRLWTSSSLAMACQLAGLSEPTVHPGLLVINRSTPQSIV